MKTIDIQEAETELSQLVTQAANGESFIITKDGKPLVMVSALDAAAAKPVRPPGFMAGEIAVPDDFDRMGSREIPESFEE
jgi:antitoxin (DNA-binding transcriptional repressor) of toxin-antitoxin stability system